MDPSRRCRIVALSIVGIVVHFLLVGCTSTQWARMRTIPRNPLTQALHLDSRSGPRPTASTTQLLRQYDLVGYMNEPERIVAEMQEVALATPTPDAIYAVAELAYIGAKKREAEGNYPATLELFGTAVVNAYVYLFESAFDGNRNPYDPQFRRACDLYNLALESSLRYLQRTGALVPGASRTIKTGRQIFEIQVASRGTWHESHFSELRFVSDFDVKELRNHYHTFGLGVPMIATYLAPPQGEPAQRFYPPGMTFPVTAFLRVMDCRSQASQRRFRCVVELHDPTESGHIDVLGKQVPLEVDLTTPLAYALDNPTFRRANEPTQGLRDANAPSAASGLYLLEPYDPRKIPVVMIHGFWSSLVTWMDMFNDLRGSQEIRDRFQFWFYQYPSGQPFWYAADHLRQELSAARQTLDPIGAAPALDQLVLIGHSAGGLIAELQTIDSGHEFWRLVSPEPFENIAARPQELEQLRRTFFFTPDKSVQRVVTIATPHLGTTFSNGTTQWLGQKFIDLPTHVKDLQRNVITPSNRFGKESILNVATNVDALAPGSPFLLQMRVAPHAPWVKYHNIVGRVESQNVVTQKTKLLESDGVVNTESSHFPHAESEIHVLASHAKVHRHPRAILEVKRILLEHGRIRLTPILMPPPVSMSHHTLPIAAPSNSSAMAVINSDGGSSTNRN